MMPTDFVCPICKCDLVRNTDGLRCTRCHASFPRLGDDSFDFMPGEQLVNGGTAWRVRQSAMENWYRDFIGDADNAAAALAYEYEPHAAVLGRLRGTILDVGGGVGIARDYLPADAQYLVIDPSLNWLGDAWKGVGRRFPSVNRPPTFIRGVGEYLPFPDSRFDAVLSLWSLNHSSDPERTLNEIHRVLAPRGSFFLILEDMEPTWRDLIECYICKRLKRLGLRAECACDLGLIPALEKIGMTLRQAVDHKRSGRPWPIQPDHICIRDRQLRAQFRNRFDLVERDWKGGFLRYQLRRRHLRGNA